MDLRNKNGANMPNILKSSFLLHVQFIRIHVNIFVCHLKGNVVSICTSNFSIFWGEKDFIQDFSPLNIRCRFFRQVWQWFYKCLIIIKGFFILVYLSVAIIYVYIYIWFLMLIVFCTTIFKALISTSFFITYHMIFILQHFSSWEQKCLWYTM